MTAPCGVTVPLLSSVWFGKPGSIAALPLPDNVSATMDRAETDHALINGGVTTTRRPSVKRTYPLTWSQMTADQADPLVAIYAGVRGRGPFVLVDPRWRNLLDLDTSTMVGSVAAVRNWATAITAPNPTPDTAAPPAGAATSGVMRWTLPAAGDRLWAGMIDGATYSVDGRRPAPNIGQPGWLTVWARLTGVVANFNATLSVCGVPDTLTWGGLAVSSAPTPLSTSWTRLAVPIAAGTWTQAVAAYLVPSIVVSGAGVGTVSVLLAGAQLTVEPTAAGAAAALPFNVGLGCPRVGIGSGFPDTSSVWWRRSHTLVLNEI